MGFQVKNRKSFQEMEKKIVVNNKHFVKKKTKKLANSIVNGLQAVFPMTILRNNKPIFEN